MDGPALSWRERRILAEVETGLRSERSPDRALRTMRPRLRHRIARGLGGLARVPLGILVLLVGTSLLLVAPGVQDTGVPAFFGTVWLTTAVLVAARLAAHHRGRGHGP